MTVYYPERFNQARPAGFDGLFDWDFLKGAFGPVIMPMDLDGVIERNGRFLVFETKEPGKPIPKGQEISLKALCATGIFTIFVVYGKTAETLVTMDEWHKSKNLKHESVDAELVWQRANKWFLYVSSLPKLTQQDLELASQSSLAVSGAMNELESMKEKLRAAYDRIDCLTNQITKMREEFVLKPKTAKRRVANQQMQLFGLTSVGRTPA